MKIKVSLIVPVYNTEKYLKKCLDSAISQTLQAIEIIIIDDGSTDNSPRICKDYEEKDRRIKFLSQENRGQGFARNLAIKHAKGEFVFFLDSDDWIESETLEILYDKAIKDSSEAVICGWKRVDEKTNKIIATRKDIYEIEDYKKDTINKYVFSAKINLMACAILIKKSIIDDNYLVFPNCLHEDLYFMPKAYYFAKKISIVKINLYNWLSREKSTTNSFSMEHATGISGIISDWKFFLLRQGVFEKYKKEYIQGVMKYLQSYLNQANINISKYEEKSVLLNFLADILNNFSELRDYQKLLSEKELSDYSSLLEFYNSVKIGHDMNPDCYRLTIQNKTLQYQIDRINNLRGYQILDRIYKIAGKHCPPGSKKEKILIKIADLFISKNKHSIIDSIKLKPDVIQANIKNYDIVFLPHKDYHVWTMALIAKNLKGMGISSCFMDLTEYYRDEGIRKAAKGFREIELFDLSYLLYRKINYNVLVVMNDWDKKITNPLVVQAKKEGKKTVGIIEGVNDFLDKDVNWKRNAYQTVEYLLMTGEHDRTFFKNKKDKSFIVGVPRLEELLKETPKFPEKPLAVVNVNFSYGVLDDKRELWLKSAIEGCKKAKIDYVISQHPADKADLSLYNVSKKSVYDLIRNSSIVISRFSSVILEALAMGKPCVYHNPHNEKVVKFQNPMGAYSLSFDSESLAKAIQFELSLKTDYRARANNFLHYHCNINSNKTPSLLAAEVIKKILES